MIGAATAANSKIWWMQYFPVGTLLNRRYSSYTLHRLSRRLERAFRLRCEEGRSLILDDAGEVEEDAVDLLQSETALAVVLEIGKEGHEQCAAHLCLDALSLDAVEVE